MAESLTSKTFKGFFWQFGGTIFKTAAQLLVLFVLARLISKADFGIVSSALIVVGLAKLVSQMGVGPALVQKSHLSSLHIRAAVTLTFFFSIFLFGVIYLSAGLISDFFRMPDLKRVLDVIAILFIIEGISTVSRSLLLREMRQKTIAIVDFISYAVGYGLVALVLAYFDFGYWALIYGQIAQSLLKFILYYAKSHHSLKPHWGKKEVKDLLYYGGGFTLAKFFNYAALEGDNVITGRYLGEVALGVYSRAYTIMVQPVALIGNAVDQALFPAMSARQNEPKKLIEAFINGSKMIHFVCIPIMVIVFLTADELIRVALGTGWEDTVIPLQILTLGLLFRMGYKMGDCLCRATGEVYSRAKRTIIYAICIFVGCYIGTHWGINGVAGGTLFAVAVNYILQMQLGMKILKINWLYFLKRSFSELPVALGVSAIFAGVIFLAKYFLQSDLLFLIAAYGLCGGIGLVLFYFFSDKLSFIEILPFKQKLKRFTRNRE